MSICKAFIAAWSSRKLWAFIITVALVWAGLERIINHMYAMPPDKVPYLVNIGGIAFGIIGCAAGAYMGFQSWTSKFNADSVVQAVASTVTEKREDVQKIISEYADKYKDDPSYRPIE